MVKTVKRKVAAKKPVAKKPVARKAATRKSAVKKTKKKAKRKARASSPLTKLERALYERMVEIDELAADMGLLGAVEAAPKKSKKKR